MSLATIAQSFETFAAEELAILEDEGLKLAEKVASDAEVAFEAVVARWGGPATKLVTNLMQDDSLSGLAKANLAATTLVDQAAQQNIDLAGHKASALIEWAYQAVTAQLAALKP